MFKNLITFFICILFSIQSCGFLNFWNYRDHEIRESYYDNGSLEYQSSYYNDRLDGPSSHYSINGILLSYAEYEGGSPHGLWKTFYETGELKYSCTYFHGNKHGDEKYFYKNGQKQSLTKYDYGKEINEIIRWDKNGELLY